MKTNKNQKSESERREAFEIEQLKRQISSLEFLLESGESLRETNIFLMNSIMGMSGRSNLSFKTPPELISNTIELINGNYDNIDSLCKLRFN